MYRRRWRRPASSRTNSADGDADRAGDRRGSHGGDSRREELIASIDPALPIVKVSNIEDLVSASVAQPRFNMTLLASLAICAALLAAVGVYGVVTYSVARRVEIGVRMALGADADSTFKLVVWGALKVVLVGVAVELAGEAAAGRSIRACSSASRRWTCSFVVSGLAIIVVGIVAASLPALARRGSIRWVPFGRVNVIDEGLKAGVVNFYDAHPINEHEIWQTHRQGHRSPRADRSRAQGVRSGSLRRCSDRYMAKAGRFPTEHRVLDVCGNSGPARWMLSDRMLCHGSISRKAASTPRAAWRLVSGSITW
jgi:hypothetical protein